jgi:transcriptional regulator with XRE-family HTH domain
MNILQNMRRKLGISQSALAEWLGISRSHLAMIEANRRRLPGAYVLKLAELASKKQNNKPAPGQPMEEHIQSITAKDADVKLKELLLSRCSLELRKLNKLFSQMQAKYIDLEESRKLIEGLSGNEPGNAGKEVYWRIQYENVLSKLERCGPGQQARIARRIVMLSAEALHYRLSG